LDIQYLAGFPSVRFATDDSTQGSIHQAVI
jgi:hypothetical protein